eukprot:GHVU01011700.1.p1 GENE.GHVU01011700.1~~GHVU01011700.1.p1  ORF type:complete len:357 (+),score=50.57 GHVU01011700.1:572-1642(+)
MINRNNSRIGMSGFSPLDIPKNTKPFLYALNKVAPVGITAAYKPDNASTLLWSQSIVFEDDKKTKGTALWIRDVFILPFDGPTYGGQYGINKYVHLLTSMTCEYEQCDMFQLRLYVALPKEFVEELETKFQGARFAAQGDLIGCDGIIVIGKDGMMSAKGGIRNVIEIGQISMTDEGQRGFIKASQQGFVEETTWRASVTARVIINANVQSTRYQRQPLEMVLKIGTVCLTRAEPNISWTQSDGTSFFQSAQVITDNFDDIPICEHVYVPKAPELHNHLEDLSDTTSGTATTGTTNGIDDLSQVSEQMKSATMALETSAKVKNTRRSANIEAASDIVLKQEGTRKKQKTSTTDENA